MAWAGLPLALYVTSFGLGALCERLLRVTLPGALLAPLGFCASIVVLLPLYRLGSGAWPAAALLLILAAAGLVAVRRELPGRLWPGWPGGAGLAVYAVYVAPVVLSGSWTWGGYNFLNDTAVQFLLAERLQDAGATKVHGAPSTGADTINVYLESGYPLGSHAPLATLGRLLAVPVEVIYQSYLAAMAALAAMALAQLASRSGLSARPAAAAGALAMCANLTFHYALQGSVKEIAMLCTLAISAAVGRELLDSDRPVRMAAAVAICMAAGLAVFNVAGGPYLAGLALALLGASFLDRSARLEGARLRVLGVGAAIVVAASVPTLLVLSRFFAIARGTFDADESGAASPLGQLARPLPLQQMAGVWLDGDYTLPVPGWRMELLTTVAIVAIFALLVAGVAWLVSRRETGPLLLLVSAAVALVVMGPRATPYADAKLLAIASPAVVFCAAFGLLALRRAWAPAAPVLAAGLAAAVLLSDFYAYQAVRLAPMERLKELYDTGGRFEGDGSMLVNEHEELAKYLLRDGQVNVASEAITPLQAVRRDGRPFTSEYIDLDDQALAYVERFPLILQRRSPVASRPPANYGVAYGSRHYVVWRRAGSPRVLRHLSLGDPGRASDVPDCRAVRALARRARPGERLVAASPRELAELDLPSAPRRPTGWVPDDTRPGYLRAVDPGRATAALDVAGGRYRVWLKASVGRPVEVSIDGEKVGTARDVNTPEQWLPVGVTALRRGRHALELRRGSRTLKPGDAARTYIGPAALERVEPGRLVQVSPRQAKQRLCGRAWDWIELVAPR